MEKNTRPNPRFLTHLSVIYHKLNPSFPFVVWYLAVQFQVIVLKLENASFFTPFKPLIPEGLGNYPKTKPSITQTKSFVINLLTM